VAVVQKLRMLTAIWYWAQARIVGLVRKYETKAATKTHLTTLSLFLSHSQDEPVSVKLTHSLTLWLLCLGYYGDRSFAVYGPCVWNSLPDELRSSDITLTTFRNKLKTLLFNV